MFTDESSVMVNHRDRRTRVWRRAGERYQDAAIVQHDRWGGGSVMVWGRNWWNGRTDLVILDGNLTGQRYLDQVIQPQVLPHLRTMGNGAIYQDDNAPPHRARIVNAVLHQENINHMDWPAKSPDLNPIENLWDDLKRRVSNRPHSPHTVAELCVALVEEWQHIPQLQIQNLINSMRHRCVAVCRANGSYSKY